MEIERGEMSDGEKKAEKRKTRKEIRRREGQRGCRVTGDHYVTVSDYYCFNSNIKCTHKYFMGIIVVQYDEGILFPHLYHILCNGLDLG